ncbi:MAG: Gldg family protein [Armatimonadetes bacterium]|nr:Gldg family protein [Anaerolineae bacterium]
MSQNTTPQSNLDPIIPPSLLIGGAVIALAASFGVAFTGGSAVVVVALLAVALLMTVGWALFAPDQFRALLQGRGLRFGGLSIVVTLVFIIALITVYAFIKDQATKRNWRLDLTQTDTYSLNPATRDAIAAIGADPNVPSVKILAFYSSAQAGQRDQNTLLFDDYVSAGGTKISYEFIDPDRNPLLTEQYGVTQPGQVVVVANKPDGTPDTENAQLVTSVTQQELNRGILRAVARGDFRIYFLGGEGALEIDRSGRSGLSSLNDFLETDLGWTSKQVSVVDLLSGTETLTDPLASGTVLVIPGGQSALPDDMLAFLQTYLDAGGDAIILADTNPDVTEQALTTADNLTAYLQNAYGVSFNRNIVLDDVQALQSGTEFFTTTFDAAHPITRTFTASTAPAFLFDSAHAIDISALTPVNVTITTLVSASATSYTRPVEAVLAEQIAKTDTDPAGPFPLVVAAENTVTGSRILLIGSKDVPSNRYVGEFGGADVLNFDLMFNGITWTTRFDDFLSALEPALVREVQAQDAQIFASEQTLTAINLITVLLLPFGTLGIGMFVWSNRRRNAVEES